MTDKTIGTGGDYSTLQSWENDSPADLVSAADIWRGKVKNQEFDAGSSSLLTISGQTTDASFYVELTTDTGASFADNANKLTNALRYNASNGAAIKSNIQYGAPINVSTNYTRINKLQIKNTFSTTSFLGLATLIGDWTSANATNNRFDQMIFQSNDASQIRRNNGATFTNCLFIYDLSENTTVIDMRGTSTFYSCTFIRPSDKTAGGTAARNAYATSTYKNCAFFGYTTCTGGSNAGNNNATDQSSTGIGSGTGDQTSVSYSTSTFQQPSNASSAMDYRAVSGSALENHGADLSGSGVTVDIVGQSRSATPTIGCWEIVSGGGGGGSAVGVGLTQGILLQHSGRRLAA